MALPTISFSVIPAKAGIQFPCAIGEKTSWIPAFGGMTGTAGITAIVVCP